MGMISALSAALALMAGDPAATAGFEPFEPEDHPGVWHSRGYGYVLQLEAGQARLFHVAGDVCVEEPDVPASILPHWDLARRTPGGPLVLSSVLDPYHYVFDARPDLPAACLEPAPTGPEAVFEAFATYFSEHYAYFDLYGVDWAERVARAQARVSADMSEQELFELMSEMLEPLHDSHLKLVANIDGETREHDGGRGRTGDALAALAEREGIDERRAVSDFRRAYWFDGIGQSLLGGEGVIAANGRIQYGMVAESVGYLAVVTMGGYVSGEVDTVHEELPVLDAAMEDAFALFEERGAEAVIVDLSLNTGGYDFVGVALAGRFAAAPVTGFTRRAGDDPDAIGFPIRVIPSSGARFTGPVYLMTTDLTASAAEIAVLAMRELENVTHVGEPTRGAFSTVLDKPLGNGWTVSLSNEIYRDNRGVSWEGAGIEPELAITVFDQTNPFRGHVEAVRELLERLETR